VLAYYVLRFWSLAPPPPPPSQQQKQKTSFQPSLTALYKSWLPMLVYYTGLCVCFHSSTMEFLLYVSIVQFEGRYSDTSKIALFAQDVWVFMIFCGSIWILELISLFLWRMTLEFWWELHWVHTFLLVVQHFHNINSVNL
jgi:hypothetical protein